MSELLLGCGHQRVKLAYGSDKNKEWTDLVTLDINPDCDPDIICDLNKSHWTASSIISTKSYFFTDELYFKESMFAEVHAYEVLEHLGCQGDISSFFSTFANIYRVLIPGGMLFCTCPSRHSPWLWGDPGHTRVIQPESLVFLDQGQYTSQLGITSMSDYRYYWPHDFKILSSTDDETFHRFVLQAIKPSRFKR